MLKKLPASAGIFKDSPSLTSEGFWSDGKNVRFFRGKPEKIGGWTKFSTSSITGKGRTLISFSDTTGKKFLLVIQSSLQINLLLLVELHLMVRI